MASATNSYLIGGRSHQACHHQTMQHRPLFIYIFYHYAPKPGLCPCRPRRLCDLPTIHPCYSGQSEARPTRLNRACRPARHPAPYPTAWLGPLGRPALPAAQHGICPLPPPLSFVYCYSGQREARPTRLNRSCRPARHPAPCPTAWPGPLGRPAPLTQHSMHAEHPTAWVLGTTQPPSSLVTPAGATYTHAGPIALQTRPILTLGARGARALCTSHPAISVHLWY